VKAVIDQAKMKYDTSTKDTKARRWLLKFSARIMYYGQVLDMLAQQEYAALAWGSIKFVLTVRACYC
jgi:hypothetical protein